MSFQLVYGDRELALTLAFDVHVEDRLVGLISMCEPDPVRAPENELAVRIVHAITAAIEKDIGPPTDKQLKYAVAIARRLNLQLSAEVLQSREAMAGFLNMHADEYRRRKRSVTNGVE